VVKDGAVKFRFLAIQILLIFVCGFIFAQALGQGQEAFTEGLLKGFTYRNLGPYRNGAWISDFAVPDYPAEAPSRAGT